MPNYVTSELNRICTAAEVQCTLTFDPADCITLYQFKCLGDYGVEITDGKATYIMNPGDEFSLKTKKEPRITKWFLVYDRVFNQ